MEGSWTVSILNALGSWMSSDQAADIVVYDAGADCSMAVETPEGEGRI
jgi:hypothetical protein